MMHFISFTPGDRRSSHPPPGPLQGCPRAPNLASKVTCLNNQMRSRSALARQAGAVGSDLVRERDEWRRLGWDAAAAQPTWPAEVAAGIRGYFERGGHMIEPATLVSVVTGMVGAVPVVDVVYQHPYHPRGPVGLRLKVDEPPLGVLGIGEGDTVLDLFVSIVCYYTIGDPPGSSQDAYVRDEAGIWWWGYGFTEPELGEPGYSDPPWHPLRRLGRLLRIARRLAGTPRLRGRPRRS